MGKAKNEKLDTPPRDKLLRNKLITQLKEDCMLLEDGQLGRPFAWDAFEGIYDLVERIRSLEPKKQSPWSKSSREESLEAFKQWCAAEEIIVSGVEIAPFESYGLGLKCTEDSPVGKCLVSVPEKCMMTLKTASKGSLGLLASDDPILKHMPNVLLALHVLEERWSPNSFWLAYLNVLPNEYSNTLYFTKEEYQLLKGSHALEEATNQYRCIARQYAYFSGLFKTCTLTKKLNLVQHFTFDQYRWAVSTVMTRQNSVPGEDGRPSLALIPFYDMANHANGPFSSGWNAEKRWCECLCPRDVKAGEQVFIFYGVRSNGEFLVHNGFVYPENEEDVVALRLGLGRSGSDPGVERKLRILSRLGMASPHTFSLSPRRHPFESGDLLAFLRLFHLTPVEVSKFEGNEEKLREPGMFSQELDSKCKEFLQNRISLLLRAYPRSLQEDEGLLSSGDSLSHRGRLAVSLTMTEKKIFNCLLQHLNDS